MQEVSTNEQEVSHRNLEQGHTSETFGQAEHDPHQHEPCTTPTPTPKLNPLKLFKVN